MKKQFGIIILVVVCAGLIIALIAGKKQADAQRKKDADTILGFSNQLTAASASLDELRRVNLVLSNDFDASREALVTFSNQYVATSASFSNAKTALKAAQDQIADLEAQNKALDQRAAVMNNTLAGLSTQIAETQTKLVKSETNNAFLENELKHQMAKKAELERRFNDLSQVRAQVKKLQDQLLVARRLEWTRNGVHPEKQQKGAQLLMTRTSATSGVIRPPAYNLNVEAGSEGSVKVIPALTNAPATINLWRW